MNGKRNEETRRKRGECGNRWKGRRKWKLMDKEYDDPDGKTRRMGKCMEIRQRNEKLGEKKDE